jgi:thiol-disulfide isomerase/thioredoxin
MIRYLDVLFVALATVGLCGCESPMPAERPQLYVFTADWCPTCPKAAELDRLANEYPFVDVYQFNIDRDIEAKEKYNVTKVPFFVLCSEEGCWPSDSFREVKGWLDGF